MSTTCDSGVPLFPKSRCRIAVLLTLQVDEVEPHESEGQTGEDASEEDETGRETEFPPES